MLGFLVSFYILVVVYYLICTDHRRNLTENIAYFISLHIPPFVKDWIIRSLWFSRKSMSIASDIAWSQKRRKWPFLDVKEIPQTDDHPEFVVIRPPNAKQEKLPVVYWMHGGGWVLGSKDDVVALEYCYYLNAVAISVEYRLAPEHPFPAAADDAIAGMKWIWENIDEFGDKSRFCISGYSAGGQLACVCAQVARDLSIPLFMHIPVAPVIHPFIATSSALEHSILNTPFLSVKKMVWFFSHYFGRDPRTDFRANVLGGGSVRNVSRALLCLGKFDILLHDGEDYAKALKEENVDVEVVHLNGGHMSVLTDSKGFHKFLLKVKAALTASDSRKRMIHHECMRI